MGFRGKRGTFFYNKSFIPLFLCSEKVPRNIISPNTSIKQLKNVGSLYHTIFSLFFKNVRVNSWRTFIVQLTTKTEKNLFALNYIITTKLSKHAWLHYTLPSLKNLDFSVPTFKIFTCKYSVSSMGFSCAIHVYIFM